ncbi:MAG: HAMP domain-containing histidine kinase [Lachnospiraceae bacterium]|nr:HAMP domain-containing histidine kinase [Lachnospiraceae bacterium]
MKKIHLKTSLSLILSLLVALTVLLVSIFSGIFINKQFEEYVKNTQKNAAEELAESIGSNYDESLGGFNLDYVHGMGMYALKEGYIIRLYDRDKNLLWDAENHDMMLCHEVMDGIMTRMKEKKPELKGEFVSYSYELKKAGNLNGILEVSYYTPFYLNENEFQFIKALNIIIGFVGGASILIAAFLGVIIAGRITRPISGVIAATKKISGGDYSAEVKTDIGDLETYELARSVNSMAETLKEQEYLRRQLTADIAHELRTPVTNISSYMEMMIDDVMEPTKERLSSCYNELSRLSELIKDLERLENAELETVLADKEDVELLGLCGSILQGFSTKISEKNIEAKLEGKEVTVKADRIRIGQVVANLLSNAIKYTDEGGEVKIHVGKNEAGAVIAVEDTGIGIPEKEQNLVFERFYRTDKSRARKTGGAGIGLSISRAIVKAHNGTIRCESSPGKGSIFTVSLPLE